jgi:hypothetical protein
MYLPFICAKQYAMGMAMDHRSCWTASLFSNIQKHAICGTETTAGENTEPHGHSRLHMAAPHAPPPAYVIPCDDYMATQDRAKRRRVNVKADIRAMKLQITAAQATAPVYPLNCAGSPSKLCRFTL